jgi:hypothetical protein
MEYLLKRLESFSGPTWKNSRRKMPSPRHRAILSS